MKSMNQDEDSEGDIQQLASLYSIKQIISVISI